ncbi:MAG: hypothetical protein IKD04_08280 [Clostridia bacterium]|nr:hypothetical protein [Clostridia bacterium]
MICHLSCDGDYTLYVNGKYVSSNQYGDFEHYKIYDSIDITEYLNHGENEIYFLVWHFGIPSSRYRTAKAGLLYALECDGVIAAKSSAETLSRQNPNFKSNYCKKITGQLGQSFLYDATASQASPYTESVIVDKKCQLYPRHIKKAELLEKMEIKFLKKDDRHFLINLGEETVGLPVLRFFSETEQKIYDICVKTLRLCLMEHYVDTPWRE